MLRGGTKFQIPLTVKTHCAAYILQMYTPEARRVSPFVQDAL